MGSYLIPRLIEAGCQHLVLVDKNPVENRFLVDLQDRNVRVDMYRTDTLLGLPASVMPDILVSLAGVTNVDDALVHPMHAFEGNISVAIELGEWVRTHCRLSRVIHISSDEVLGESTLPLDENSPLRPTQPYAASKAAAEIVLRNYRDVYGLDIIILRSCNLVGGRQKARKLIPVAVKSLLAKMAVPIYGSGMQKREWMAVEDLCDAIVELIGATSPEGIYQAATGVHLTTLEVVGIVAEALNRPPLIETAADRQVHDSCYAMITTRLKALGWAPMREPRDAIRKAAVEMSDPAHSKQLEFSIHLIEGEV